MSSEKKRKASHHEQKPSSIEILRSIKPRPQIQRFLISWDPQRKLLRFGCGNGESGAWVDSNKKVEQALSLSTSFARLSPRCVEHFISDASRIDGGALLTRCQAFLRSYVHFDDERLYVLLGVWSLATYVYVLFSHFGYMFFHSQFKRSGKTRAEEILSHLCFEATGPLNSPTVPTIRDTASEGGTLILDTLERWKGKCAEAYSAAMELLDAGFRNGGTVAKMVPSMDGQWRRELISVFAPYVLAAIAEESLADTARDRSFVIQMKRKDIRVKKKKYDFNSCEKECASVRDDLYIWALQNAAALATIYTGRKLEVDVDRLELNDRAADIWKPLLAIARFLGDEDGWKSLSSLAVEMAHDPDAADRARMGTIAKSLRKLVNGTGCAVGMTTDFLKQLRTDGLEIEQLELHRVLEAWGFSQKNSRLGLAPRRAWELEGARLAEIEKENRSGFTSKRNPMSPS
ncbi:MAG: DUF3631 domain-containing protein [Candidatus Korobacteraceae bacterium]